MSRSLAPEVATPRVMAVTLATFYCAGGVVGLLGVLGGAPDGPNRGAVVAISLLAIGTSGVIAGWGARWPRWSFHVPVGLATVLIALAAYLAPDRVTAVVIAAIIAFVGIDSYFFFRRPEAAAHLLAAIGLTSVALVARGDVAPATALAVDVIVLAQGVVVRRLVMRASTANRDPLTGLANRRGFDERLQELVGRPAVLSAALLDVDHFKQVNDTLGHAAGDQVLCSIAETWSRLLPSSAVLARHGGDEFALLLPGTPGPEALALVDRVRTLHPQTGLSIGVAQARRGESAAQLMRRADAALYRAKSAGRGRCALEEASSPLVPTAVGLAPLP